MIQLELDSTRRPFGVIAGKRMTRVCARPVEEVMRRLEAVEAKDWFPLGMEVSRQEEARFPGQDAPPPEGPWLTFAIAIDDIEWWVEHLSG